MRKGKQILLYEFNLEVEFHGKIEMIRGKGFLIFFAAENEEEEADGYFKIHDINPDDLDFEVNRAYILT